MLGERDVFVAHAHQDKQEFVRPLVTALGRRAVSCWVDEAAIGPGDSLIEAINEGLAAARYVAVPITHRMLAAPWASRELNAALQREVRQGKTIVIPILAVSPAELDAYPLLLDKRWLSWSDGVDAVADAIAAMFERDAASDWHVDFPRPYVGPVWVRVLARPQALGSQHHLTLRWGPHIRRVSLSPSRDPISLSFHKLHPDSVTLHVEVQPAATLTFGSGSAPDEHGETIDEGWERSAGWSFPTATLHREKPQATGTETTATASELRAPMHTEGLYHVRLSRLLLLTAEAFNLSAPQLEEQFLRPWRSGAPIFLKGRSWFPSQSRLTIYQGSRISSQQRGFGLGWSKATEFGEDVTDELLRAPLSV